MVDVFVQEEFGYDGVAYVGEGGDGGGGEREVDDAQGEEHGEEVEGHAERAGEEERAGKHGADGAEVAAQAGAVAEMVEVAEAVHGGGYEALAGDGQGGDEEDAGPGVNPGRGLDGQVNSFSRFRMTDARSDGSILAMGSTSAIQSSPSRGSVWYWLRFF